MEMIINISPTPSFHIVNISITIWGCISACRSNGSGLMDMVNGFVGVISFTQVHGILKHHSCVIFPATVDNGSLGKSSLFILVLTLARVQFN